MQRYVFPLGLFLSASLLFAIQPMVAKILLPVYGGAPAVWTVCLLFFQSILLIAYGYVWLLSRMKGTRSWRAIHLLVCVFSLCALPLTFVPMAGPGSPELNILTSLLLSLGLPLLVIGSSAPLLQYAFSQTGGNKASDPYFLYTASNVGSLLALLSYPWLLERFWGVSQLLYAWNVIYILYLVALFWVLFAVKYKPITMALEKSAKLLWSRCAFWIFLSFVACSLMLGVTFYISTDIAATPLFWVLPLALYLLSFVVTFASKPLIPHEWVVRSALFFFVFPVLGFIIGANQIQAWQLIIANLVCFFILALLCHGELVRTRPEANQLTTFYFCLALGGVIAGLFNGLLASRLFSHAYEYPFVMLLALLCLPVCQKKKEWMVPVLVLSILCVNYFFLNLSTAHMIEILALGLILFRPASSRSLFLSMLILFAFVFMPWFKPMHILSQQRNFYGVKQVFSQGGAHVLMSQSTSHGFQMEGEVNPTDGARAYYASVLPVVQKLQALHEPLHSMVLGLGTGIMACQFRKNDELSMVEVDDQVIDIATNPNLFTYLRDCPPKVTLIKEDGRMAVARAKDASYDLLVMDAFHSDAIPVHLLTLEAFALYQKKIKSDGVVLVNISNRHLRVLPVLTAAGRHLDMIVLHKQQAANERLGQLASEWALLTTNERLAGSLMSKEGWRFVADTEARLWTNDYSNIIPLFKWRS